ncbi:MAG: hypothetical protein LBQ24_06655 [Candidatus Peribacteria bacterium]|jgi:hypothetical protein|nr:hypothetical protein [Candidatus Peribacteria bacterium]
MKRVGKSVNLFAISSICLVTQFIKNEGKELILFCTTFVISEKSILLVLVSILIETASPFQDPIVKSGQESQVEWSTIAHSISYNEL